MDNIKNLTEYKRLKKAVKIEEDLTMILRILELSYLGLSNYTHYATVTNLINSIQDSKMYLAIHLNKTKKLIEKEGKLD